MGGRVGAVQAEVKNGGVSVPKGDCLGTEL